MTPQAKVSEALARLARMSPRWRAAIPLVFVRVTRSVVTVRTVGNHISIGPQFVAEMTSDDTANILAHEMLHIREIRDIVYDTTQGQRA